MRGSRAHGSAARHPILENPSGLCYWDAGPAMVTLALVLSWLLSCLLVPPLVAALAGGGEWIAGPLRLAFYDLGDAALTLAGVSVWMLRPPRAGRFTSALAALSLISLACATALQYAPVRDAPVWLDLKAERLILGGWLLWALAAWVGRRGAPGPGGALRAAVLVTALAAGAALHAGLARLDRDGLAQRLAGEPAARAAPQRAPDLLLIVVDALRADALEARHALPFLAELAEKSLVFQRAVAPAPWTVPSVIALMTGRYPSSIDPVDRGRAWCSPEDRAAQRLPSEVPRLAERLSEAGYATAGFTKTPFLAPGAGFEQGFAVYERVHGDTAERHSAGQLVGAALRWARAMAALRSRGDRRPWFLYLHFMDSHINYDPPPAFHSPRARAYRGPMDGRAASLHRMLRDGAQPDAADAAQLRELYAGEVRYLDGELERLFSALSGAGLVDERTVVVFTADHGEQFGEHGGWEHGDIHLENVAVPLMLRAPGLTPGRRDDPASLVDLMPTLAALLGLPSLDLGDGRNLLAGEDGRARVVMTDYGDRLRVTGSRWALLRRGLRPPELYDLLADPGETRDLAGERADVVAALTRLAEAHEARPPLQLEAAPDDRLELDLDALRALGYF